MQHAQLEPLMKSAQALQIKGLCGDDKTFNDFSAAVRQNIFSNTQGTTILLKVKHPIENYSNWFCKSE